VPPPERTLLVCFESAEAFREEYESNLANGGVFVATDEPFELREAVSVQLQLDWSGERASLRGEIVHLVPPEIAAAGGTPPRRACPRPMRGSARRGARRRGCRRASTAATTWWTATRAT